MFRSIFILLLTLVELINQLNCAHLTDNKWSYNEADVMHLNEHILRTVNNSELAIDAEFCQSLLNKTTTTGAKINYLCNLIVELKSLDSPSKSLVEKSRLLLQLRRLLDQALGFDWPEKLTSQQEETSNKQANFLQEYFSRQANNFATQSAIEINRNFLEANSARSPTILNDISDFMDLGEMDQTGRGCIGVAKNSLVEREDVRSFECLIERYRRKLSDITSPNSLVKLLKFMKLIGVINDEKNIRGSFNMWLADKCQDIENEPKFESALNVYQAVSLMSDEFFKADNDNNNNLFSLLRSAIICHEIVVQRDSIGAKIGSKRTSLLSRTI